MRKWPSHIFINLFQGQVDPYGKTPHYQLKVSFPYQHFHALLQHPELAPDYADALLVGFPGVGKTTFIMSLLTALDCKITKELSVALDGDRKEILDDATTLFHYSAEEMAERPLDLSLILEKARKGSEGEGARS